MKNTLITLLLIGGTLVATAQQPQPKKPLPAVPVIFLSKLPAPDVEATVGFWLTRGYKLSGPIQWLCDGASATLVWRGL